MEAEKIVSVVESREGKRTTVVVAIKGTIAVTVGKH